MRNGLSVFVRFGALLWSATAAIPASASTTWTVTTNAEPATLTTNDCSGTLCATLRGAINAASSDDTIQFDRSLDDATIILTLYSDDLAGFEFGPSAFFIEGRTLTIDASANGLLHGVVIVRSGASSTPDFRLFDVDYGSSLTLIGLTLSNGFAQGGSSNAGGGALGAGGAIFNQGTLSLRRCTLADNTAQGGGGSSAAASAGAGVGENSSSANGGGPNGGAGGANGDSGSPGGFPGTRAVQVVPAPVAATPTWAKVVGEAAPAVQAASPAMHPHPPSVVLAATAGLVALVGPAALAVVVRVAALAALVVQAATRPSEALTEMEEMACPAAAAEMAASAAAAAVEAQQVRAAAVAVVGPVGQTVHPVQSASTASAASAVATPAAVPVAEVPEWVAQFSTMPATSF